MKAKSIFSKEDVANGVYIYTESGKFIAPKFWGVHEGEEKAICVVIVKDKNVLAIAPEDIEDDYVSLLDWNYNQTGKKHESIKESLLDFDGMENTKALADAGSEVAKEVIALNILSKSWHIPTMGELQLMYDNKSMVIAALAICEKSPLSDTWYWSSTRRSEKSNFVFCWSDGYRDDYNRSYSYRVRPVCAFSL